MQKTPENHRHNTVSSVLTPAQQIARLRAGSCVTRQHDRVWRRQDRTLVTQARASVLANNDLVAIVDAVAKLAFSDESGLPATTPSLTVDSRGLREMLAKYGFSPQDYQA